MTANTEAPASAATETGANTLHPEGRTTVPDSTGQGHRPITLHYLTPSLVLVPQPISDRPSAQAFIDASTLTAHATLTAGPMRLRIPDCETARFWASAFEELAAQLAIAEDDAAGLRHAETAAAADDFDDLHLDQELAAAQATEPASDAADYGDDQGNDYSALIEAEYERQDHADDDALSANDELRRAEA